MRKLIRLIFSRYAICVAMILLELALFFLLLYRAYAAFHFVMILLFLFSLACFFSVLTRDINPEYKIPWILLILLVPGMGASLYCIFSRRKMTKKEAARFETMKEKILAARPESDAVDLLATKDAAAAGRAVSILRQDPLSELYCHTRSEYFSDGRALFDRMLADILSAERFVFLEFFILEEGKLWDRIYRALLEKVNTGADVRLIYDDVGCMSTLPADFDRRMREVGISCYRFGKVEPRVSTVNNNRNHRKIAVIDGRVAYTGGVNLADEYTGEKIRFGHWKDGGIRLEGDAVAGLLALFLADDTAAKGKPEQEVGLFSREAVEGDGGFYLPFGSGPHPVYPTPVGQDALMQLINGAVHTLYITTPYLVIDYGLAHALRAAAMRGVDVRLFTPGIPDKKIIKVMTKSNYPYLLEGGVRIFEYQPGFLHEKALVADDLYAVIGTINFDYRSFVHHFEDAVWMYGSPTVLSVRDSILALLPECREILPKDAELTLPERILHRAVRLFAPLL